MADWKREPVVHFVLLGATLSVGALLLARPESGSTAGGAASGAKAERRIEVTQRDVDWLESSWESRWHRPPTDAELESLIDDFVREEILFRSAKELDLDDSDTVVRRRLIEQIQLLAASSGDAVEPSEAEIRQRFESDPERYAQPATRSFTHIFFDPEVRGETAAEDAQALLDELRAMSPAPQRAPELGDRFPMQYDYPRRSRAEVARHMGEEFADRLFELDGDGWQGPLVSEYGVHLVRIGERTETVPLGLDQVEEIVREDLVRERRERAADEFYDELKSKFEVVRGENV